MTQRLGDSLRCTNYVLFIFIGIIDASLLVVLLTRCLVDLKNKLYEKDTLNIISRIDDGIMRTEDDG